MLTYANKLMESFGLSSAFPLDFYNSTEVYLYSVISMSSAHGKKTNKQSSPLIKVLLLINKNITRPEFSPLLRFQSK